VNGKEKRAKSSERLDRGDLLLRRALDALPLSVNIKSEDGRYQFVNAHQARNAGVLPSAIVGKEVGVIGGEKWKRLVRTRDLAVLRAGEPIGPVRDDFAALFGLDGHWVTFKAPLSMNEDGVLDHVVTISFDVTPFVEAEERLREAAFTDPLTKLPNRRWFDNEMEAIAAGSDRDQLASNWLMMIDIDHFKSVNDTYGHHIGDSVIRETGVRLMKSVRSCDTATRFGGEEFVVLLSDATEGDIAAIAERVRLAFDNKPMSKIEHSPRITVSIGAAPIHCRMVQTALHRADQALYLAKAQGRNQVVIADNAPSRALAVHSSGADKDQWR
jgi:diguanylate cyclase (GGDEF)-like protein